MIRSLSLRSRCAAASSRASPPPVRVERAPPLPLVDLERLAVLRERLPLALARLLEPERLDFAVLARLPLARVLRCPLLAPVLRDPLLELDLLDPPLLDCGMVAPSNRLAGWVHPTFKRDTVVTTRAVSMRAPQERRKDG
jgi:hypothetical protein